ncbi:MAG: hypothetical protein GXO22_08880 [Aquificae bacterium]|nr:hypothetical protein [Aquificota bacterium]
MNYTNFILNYLKQTHKFVNMFLVPGFEPVIREENGEIKKILEIKLTEKDTKEILLTLRNTASIPKTPTIKEIFSFGLSEVGRIRVSYFLQRGSYVINIVKTPFIIPEPADIFTDIGEFLDFYEKFSQQKLGIFLILGNRWLSNSTFVYSLLKLINKKHKKIICTLENPISYLLRHGNSIIIQRDINVDVGSPEEAIKEIYLLDPDIIYYSSSMQTENISELEYIDLHKVNIISYPFNSYSIFKEKLENSTSSYFRKIFQKNLKEVVIIKPEQIDGKEKISFEKVESS